MNTKTIGEAERAATEHRLKRARETATTAGLLVVAEERIHMLQEHIVLLITLNRDLMKAKEA